MLIDNDFVKAEHLYRRSQLSELYARKRGHRSESPVLARSQKARTFEVKKLRKAVKKLGKATAN